MSEQKFASELDGQGKNYIYQPRYNKFYNIGYTPDFYVIGDGFYEVVGTRQAFNNNRDKIMEAKKITRLKIVSPNGTLYNYRHINKINAKTRLKIRYKHETAFNSFLFVPFYAKSFSKREFIPSCRLLRLQQ